LGNLKPTLRANLKVILLIAAVKHTDLQEYGFDAVLKPFIEDMNMLSQVGSLCVMLYLLHNMYSGSNLETA